MSRRKKQSGNRIRTRPDEMVVERGAVEYAKDRAKELGMDVNELIDVLNNTIYHDEEYDPSAIIPYVDAEDQDT